MLRTAFRPVSEKTTGLRKLNDDELHDLYASPSNFWGVNSKMMNWVGHVARMGMKRNAYAVLVGKPEGRRPIRRPRHRWKFNSKIYRKEMGLNSVD